MTTASWRACSRRKPRSVVCPSPTVASSASIAVVAATSTHTPSAGSTRPGSSMSSTTTIRARMNIPWIA